VSPQKGSDETPTGSAAGESVPLKAPRDKACDAPRWPKAFRVRSDLGNGAFSYEGAQGTDYPEFSIWRFSIFGGLKLCGDPATPSEELVGLGAITAKQEFLDRLAVIQIFG
jgi:hypothetical protein